MRDLSNYEANGKGEQAKVLLDRFTKVILSRGYKSADHILDEWFDKYMTDVYAFSAMLTEYEQGRA